MKPIVRTVTRNSGFVLVVCAMIALLAMMMGVFNPGDFIPEPRKPPIDLPPSGFGPSPFDDDGISRVDVDLHETASSQPGSRELAGKVTFDGESASDASIQRSFEISGDKITRDTIDEIEDADVKIRNKDGSESSVKVKSKD